MEWLSLISQVVISLGLLNVWLLRTGKSTPWRGGEAQNMREEFAAYGLPPWSVGVVGFLKIALAIALLVGLWIPAITRPAAIGVAVLMLGAVAMHIKVNDPPKRSLPAAILLVLSVIVIVGA